MYCGHIIKSKSRSSSYPAYTTLGTKHQWYPWSGWTWIGDVRLMSGGPHEYETVSSQVHAGPPYYHGGGFVHWHSVADSWNQKSNGVYLSKGSWPIRYTGAFACGHGISSTGVGDWGSIGNANFSQAANHSIMRHSAAAWSKFKPGQSLADAAVFVGELKDVPRMLRETARWFYQNWRNHGSRKAANAWLNTQFGWLPFVSDMRKFAYAYNNSARMLEHIKRNNAKWRKVGGAVLGESKSLGTVLSSSTLTSHRPVLESSFYNSPPNSGRFSIEAFQDSHVWFTGRFRYWIPDIGTQGWEQRARAQLFGANVTPSLVWELTPWSWLIDYFADVGQAIGNLNDGWAENTVAQSTYLMGTTTQRWAVTSVHELWNVTLTDVWEHYIQCKQRAVATPFGFGLSASDLTGRQASILAAMGISRIF